MTDTPAGPPPGLLASLRRVNREIWLLFCASFVSWFGTSLTQMYSEIYVFQLTRSNFYVSLVICAVFGVGVLSSALFMRLHKRLDLAAIVYVSELVSGLLLVGLSQIFSRQLVYVYLAIGCVYLAYGFHKPAMQTLIYDLTADKRLIRQINSYRTVITSVAMALGWIVGPFLFRKISFGGLFLVDGATYLASAVLLFLAVRKRRPGGPAEEPEETPSVQLARQRAADPRTNTLVLVGGHAVVCLVFATVTALEMGTMRSVYGLTDRGIGIFFTLWIVAEGLAGFVAMRFARPGSDLPRMVLGWFVFIASATLYPVAGFVPLAGFFFMFAGVVYSAIEIFAQNYIHQSLRPEHHPRLFAQRHLVSNVVNLAFLPLCGFVADRIGVLPTMFSGMGLALGTAALLALVARRGARPPADVSAS
ncbi:MAG: MFS transporter [Deltaproteobacteria bacterium]|nr:MFS transporter [Deltaproteobacteria bacterium]